MTTATRAANLRQQVLTRPEVIPIALLVGAWIVLAYFEPAFVSIQNVSNMFAFIPEFGMIALGMTLLLTAGIFDLSVGSVFGFVPLVMYTLVNTAGVAPELALIRALGLAVLIGLAQRHPRREGGHHLLPRDARDGALHPGPRALHVGGLPAEAAAGESILGTLLAGSIQVGSFTIYAGLIWFAVLARRHVVRPRPCASGQLDHRDRRQRTGGHRRAA